VQYDEHLLMRDGSDDELMRRAGSGDRQAFARLVDRHMPRALALATRVVGSRTDAEEIVQEAFLRTWLKAPVWRDEAVPGGARFTTWFTRVLINLCIDRRRRPALAPLEAAGEVAGHEADGFQTVARQETGVRVTAAMAALPTRQRAALSLCHWDGLSNIEAAEILGVSIGALESLLVRARRTLRSALADLAPDSAIPAGLPAKNRTTP
jgi:RNA polymerase sigma-70 factor (ECF subfamily)